jgi:hypothetical protein
MARDHRSLGYNEDQLRHLLKLKSLALGSLTIARQESHQKTVKSTMVKTLVDMDKTVVVS